MCCAHLELCLLDLIACTCSLYLVFNVQSICPIYFLGSHFSRYKSLCDTNPDFVSYGAGDVQ
jgi:hypothetical protein